jgi:DNA-binding CsgD family transcriptional regulator
MVARRLTPLLEREQESHLLLDAWRRAAAGNGSLWFLCAEAGGGKTHLASELVHATRARALWGAAEPVSPPEPYAAISRAIPDFHPAPSRAESVMRAFLLLQEAARAAPLVLVLDDLHFADEGTVAVVVRLSAECVSRPWLVLAAFRPDEGTEVLHAAMTELVAQERARRLDLPSLSREGVAALVAAVRGGTAEPQDVERIYADSGGNPWFAQALARGGGAVSTARDRMLLRLDRLEATNPGANAVLAALAPATGPLPYAVVAGLCGGDRPDLRRVLGRLREARVLDEGQGGAWKFRHELLRRSLLEGMILADRQDAHRALAVALEGHGIERAPELAMHYAFAGDARAAPWALRAARQAADVDAHQESLAQLERALGFELDPETRRTALRAAALEAHRLGRFRDGRHLAEAALAIPGGEPEVRSLLHQRAADAARLYGDGAGAAAHMDEAERVLEGRPPSFQMAYQAAGRVLQAGVRVEPERAAAAAARALAIIRQLGDPRVATRLEMEVRAFLLVSLLDCGDPAGFTLLDGVEHYVAGLPRETPDIATALWNAYASAVVSLFHAQAADLHERCVRAVERHELGWRFRVQPYRALELVQRGRYDEARAVAAATTLGETDALEAVVLICAEALCEARAGDPDRARAALSSAQAADAFKSRAIADLVRLELAMLQPAPDLGELAAAVYATTEPRRYARVAGVAAVALARSGRGAPAIPAWLVPDAPLRVMWDWAGGIARRDPGLLREVSGRLARIECPYEAALALRDAGELGGAFRALASIGATTARQQTAERLRAAGQPVPRRTRAALESDGLTATEREVVRRVADGARNEEVAAALGVSVRTVESHLARIYQKTSRRGRVALANWWRARPP